MRAVLVFVSLAVSACSLDPSAVRQGAVGEDERCHGALSTAPPPLVVPDAGTGTARVAAYDDGCAHVIASPLAPSTAWLDAQAATGACGAPPHVASDVCSEAGEMYARCEPYDFAVDGCALEAGMQLCEGTTWTVLCHVDTDCPAGFACDPLGAEPVKTCVRRCSADADCGRCELACKEGLCAPAAVPLPVKPSTPSSRW